MTNRRKYRQHPPFTISGLNRLKRRLKAASNSPVINGREADFVQNLQKRVKKHDAKFWISVKEENFMNNIFIKTGL